ncbi:hypothetical protein E2C01_058863 [Portunus trituberculatus]|uniref:Uncharacterized protein n=1 Tax=Portunus trituberculatus TaxID=210409 RepID=A0A5B7H3W3_PORTR|nr:hypothetical protein [Portunus trituberculatus]
MVEGREKVGGASVASRYRSVEALTGIISFSTSFSILRHLEDDSNWMESVTQIQSHYVKTMFGSVPNLLRLVGHGSPQPHRQSASQQHNTE